MRLARRIRRDTVERGRDINSVLEQASPFFFFMHSIWVKSFSYVSGLYGPVWKSGEHFTASAFFSLPPLLGEKSGGLG